MMTSLPVTRTSPSLLRVPLPVEQVLGHNGPLHLLVVSDMITERNAGANAGASSKVTGDVLTLCADTSQARRQWIVALKSRLRTYEDSAALNRLYLAGAR